MTEIDVPDQPMADSQSTAPTIDTDVIRTIIKQRPPCSRALAMGGRCDIGGGVSGVTIHDIRDLCDAVDTLRKHFAAQHVLIAALHRRVKAVEATA